MSDDQVQQLLLDTLITPNSWPEERALLGILTDSFERTRDLYNLRFAIAFMICDLNAINDRLNMVPEIRED